MQHGRVEGSSVRTCVGLAVNELESLGGRASDGRQVAVYWRFVVAALRSRFALLRPCWERGPNWPEHLIACMAARGSMRSRRDTLQHGDGREPRAAVRARRKRMGGKEENPRARSAASHLRDREGGGHGGRCGGCRTHSPPPSLLPVLGRGRVGRGGVRARAHIWVEDHVLDSVVVEEWRGLIRGGER